KPLNLFLSLRKRSSPSSVINRSGEVINNGMIFISPNILIKKQMTERMISEISTNLCKDKSPICCFYFNICPIYYKHADEYNWEDNENMYKAKLLLEFFSS